MITWLTACWAVLIREAAGRGKGITPLYLILTGGTVDPLEFWALQSKRDPDKLKPSEGLLKSMGI